MIVDDDENGPETDEPAEAGAFDPDVEIHAAMVARERASGSYPDGDALEAMEEPLHRLTSAAALFSDVTAESSPGLSCACGGFLSWPSRSALMRSGCFGCIAHMAGIRRGIAEARVIRGISP